MTGFETALLLVGCWTVLRWCYVALTVIWEIEQWRWSRDSAAPAKSTPSAS